MAYQLEDEEQQPQGAGRAVAGGGRGPQAPRGQTPGKGTGFVNLERVFNLNRPKAEAFAGGQVRGADKQARGAQGQGAALLSAYGDKANAAVMKGPAAGAKAYDGFAHMPAGGVSQTDAQANADNAYGFNEDITQQEGYQDASRALSDAQKRVTELGSQGGREAEAGRRGLNAGESQLSAWLQGRAGGEGIQKLSESYPGLSAMLGVGGQKALDGAKASHAAVQGAWKGLADGAEKPFKLNLDAAGIGPGSLYKLDPGEDTLRKMLKDGDFALNRPFQETTVEKRMQELETDKRWQKGIDEVYGPGAAKAMLDYWRANPDKQKDYR